MGSLVKETPWSEVTATLEVFGQHGVTREALALLRSNEEVGRRVAEFILNKGQEGSVQQKLIRQVVGDQFFGVEEWARLYGYGIVFTDQQLLEVADFPWSEDILNVPCPFVEGKIIKETHFAFLGVERTILGFYRLHPAWGKPHSRLTDDLWQGVKEIAEEQTCSFRWYLILKEIIPYSRSETYEQQLAMLPPEYEVPLAVEEVAKNILYYTKNRTPLNPGTWARCREATFVGRVLVGDLDEHGVGLGERLDDDFPSYIGIGASRLLGR